MEATASGLPSLDVFLKANKANYDLAVKAGMASLGAWAQQEDFLRREHAIMSTMDEEQLRSYLISRHQRDTAHWKMVLSEVNKLIEISKQRSKPDGGNTEA